MSESKSPVPRVWIFLGVIAAILILGDLNRRMTDARRLERDSIVLQTQVASMEADGEALRTQIYEATNEILVENWARGEARLVRPGEVLIVPVTPASGVPLPTPTPTPASSQPSPFEVWWALIFGAPR